MCGPASRCRGCASQQPQGRPAAASEARWLRLSYDVDRRRQLKGLLVRESKGGREAGIRRSEAAAHSIGLYRDNSPVVDIVLAVAAAGPFELSATLRTVLQHAGAATDDEMLWAAMSELPRRVLGESRP